jgi:histone acetyltransferase (RNA polymerase elongator complex component)
MCGLPGQSVESWRATVDQAANLPLDLVRIAPTLVLRETPLARLYERGAYQPLGLEDALEQCGYAYRRFYARGIAIARVGLGVSDEQGHGEEKILAGPWHPALRHEVESRLLREKVLQTLQHRPSAELRIHPRDISIVQGIRRANLSYWRERLGRSVCLRQESAIPRHHYATADEAPEGFFT